jgi:hypothetical protein
MKIHLFDNHTGMIEARFHPNYKTVVTICGRVKEGTLSVGAQNFDIKEGEAIVPITAFGEAKELAVSVTAKDGGKLRHWTCGKIYRDSAGAYAPKAIDGRAALIEARHEIDEMRREMYAIERRLKAHTDKAKQKFMGGHDL